jgi:very-short-patch-repair endonuclease
MRAWDDISVARARKLRREAPVAERLLWAELRGGKLGGLKFRR